MTSPDIGRFIGEQKRAIALATSVAFTGVGGAVVAQSPDSSPSAQASADTILESGDTPPALRVSIPYWLQHTAFESIEDNIESFGSNGSHIVLFSYYLERDGSIGHYDPADEDSEIIEFAHDTSTHEYVPVLALIGTEESDWDAERVVKIISNPEKRTEHIQDLLDLTEQIGADGINIDYEALPSNQRENFTAFIKELSEVMHANDKKVGVSLHIKYGEEHDWNSKGAGAQDFEALGQYADYLAPMSIDETGDWSDPGPSRSCYRYELLTDYATNEIPSEKVFMLNPVNADIWVKGTTNSHEIEYGQMQEIILEKDLTPEFIPDQCGSVVEYKDKGKKRVAWFDDAQSVKARMEISTPMGANIGLWSIGNEAREDGLPGRDGKIPGPGGEDPKIWDLFVSLE